jgi:4-hydroxyphenylacetate 3-monooxygenase
LHSHQHSGLKFLCRESFDYGRSRYDHPLGPRFEELDSVVMFEDVFVPWERVLLYPDVARCNAAFARTSGLTLRTHQVVVKNLAKTEYLSGLASLMAHTIGIEILGKLAQIWVNMETMRAFSAGRRSRRHAGRIRHAAPGLGPATLSAHD